MQENINSVKIYLDFCVDLEKNGIHHGLELIRHDINKILDAKVGDIVDIGSIMSKTKIKIK